MSRLYVDVSSIESRLSELKSEVSPKDAYEEVGRVNFGMCGDGTCSGSCSGGCGASCKAWD